MSRIFFVFFFFFQAEDGIRDAQESRGLGDVYKRQRQCHSLSHLLAMNGADGVPLHRAAGAQVDGRHGAVSYTHLTLPTIYSV